MDEFLHQRRLDRTLVSVDAVGDHIELQLWTDGSASTERPRLVLLTGLVHIAVDVNVDQLIALCGELERLVDELLERRRAAHVNAESAGLAEVE